MKRLRNKTIGQLHGMMAGKQLDKPKPVNIKLLILWIFCGICFLYSIFYVRGVLIDMAIPILFGSVCGLAGILFTKGKGNYFAAFIGYGSLGIAVPLFINNAFTDSKTTDIKVEILEKHERQGRHLPSVDINYKDFNKSIYLDNDGDLPAATYVILKVSKGRLGYDIIRGSKLSKL